MNDRHTISLDTAKAYVGHWAAGDFAALRGLLDENATIVLPNSGDTPTPSFVFTGIEESLGYLQFAFATFERLTFRDEEWVVSQDARYVYLHAVGDMIVKANGRKYENVYVLRLELGNGKITDVREYTNPIIWNNLGLN